MVTSHAVVRGLICSFSCKFVKCVEDSLLYTELEPGEETKYILQRIHTVEKDLDKYS
jgi:hypothetical protein